jgi:chemotaxis protein MotB
MKMNRPIKYSKGYLTGVTLPLIIITAIVGVGSYLFYDEHKSNQAINLFNQKEKKDLQANLKRSQSNIDLLESRQQQLDNQNRSLNVQVNNHQQATDNLNQRILQLENSVTELQYEQTLVQSRNAVLESNLVEFGNELIAADDRSGMLETALTEEQTKLQLAVGNTVRLKNEMQQMIAQESVKSGEMEKKLNDQSRSLNEQIDNHQLRADNLNRRIFQLESNLTELQNEQTLVQDKNTILENNLVEFGNKLTAADNRSEMLQAALTEEQTKLQLAMENTARLKTNMQTMIVQVSVQSDAMEKELGQRQAQQASLNSQIDTVSEEKKVLFRQLQKEQQRRLLIQNQVILVNQSIDNKTEALSIATQGFEQLQSTLYQIRVQKERETAEFAALKKRLEQELNQTQVKVTQLKNQMRVINLSSEVLFNSGSAEIKPAGQKVLALIASTLNNYPNRQVFIEGHTDDIPMGQNLTYSSNWELSSARAISAVEILQENNQVAPERLKVVGHGEFKPVTSNETEEGRRLNRRIEIKLLPETGGSSG